MKQIFVFLLTVSLLTACVSSTNNNSQNIGESFETIEIKYASHLKIKKFSDYYLVEIRNPWDTLKILQNYIIVDKNSDKRLPVPENSTLIKAPVDNALVFTSLHSHLIKELGCMKSIGAVCDADYILDSDIKDAVSRGEIENLGSSMSPDIEKIIMHNPDAIFLSPFENSNGYGTLSKAKSPIVECADYMENSPLGQAEWIKFYGLLMGKSAQADSIFKSVEQQYNSLSAKALTLKPTPTIFANIPMSGTWYIPTGKSTAGRFYADAGANYLFSYLDGYGTRPLDFEKVFAEAHDSDIWVFKYSSESDYTLESLSKENANFKNFKAFKSGRVYGCNLSYSPFYDEVPFHPELLLQDLIKICYPDALDNYSLKYYKLLK